MKSLEALEAWLTENSYAMLAGVNGYYITQSEDGKTINIYSGEWGLNETYDFSINGIDQMEKLWGLNSMGKIPDYRSIHEFYKTEKTWIIENDRIKYTM